MFPSNAFIKPMREMGLLAPLRHEWLPNLDALHPLLFASQAVGIEDDAKRWRGHDSQVADEAQDKDRGDDRAYEQRRTLIHHHKKGKSA